MTSVALRAADHGTSLIVSHFALINENRNCFVVLTELLVNLAQQSCWIKSDTVRVGNTQ